MEKSAFDALDLNHKAEIVWNEATYIESISYYRFNINIYSWKNAFIEVYYSPEANDIEKISLMEEMDLQKYLSRIKLDL